MYETANAALDSARELGLPADAFRQVGPKQWRRILASIFDAFANTHRTDATWLWTKLKFEGVSAQMDNARSQISPLVAPRTPVWLLLETGMAQNAMAITGCLRARFRQSCPC